VREEETRSPLASVDELRARIRGAGLRSTVARMSVLETVERAGHPLSHGEVAAALVERGIDYATVYRNLTDLTEAGLLARVDLGDRTWRFRPSGPIAHRFDHPHFICSGCGAVVCLPTDVVALQPGRRSPTALRRQAVAIQLEGLCDECDEHPLGT
jgi:Fur family transcriptional regulator, ferric uptake regulator